MLVHDFLIQSATRFPAKEAVIEANQRATYTDILQNASVVANWLSNHGVVAGDRVIVMEDKPIDYISYYFGTLMVGGVVVAMNTQTSADSAKYQVENCDASFVLTNAPSVKYFKWLLSDSSTLKGMLVSRNIERLPEDVAAYCDSLEQLLENWEQHKTFHTPVQPTDLAQIIYTSGTTGDPNGVMLSHANLVENTQSIVDYLRLTESDKAMAVLPFFYSYGNSLLLTHFLVGGSLVVNQSFVYPNVILDKMKEEEVTGFSGVPSTFAIFMNRSAIRKYQFPSLRYVCQAGGAMAPSLAKEVKDILPDSDIYIMYGQTEASARLSYLEPCDFFRKAGSIGKAIPGVELNVLKEDGSPVAVGEVGEIVATGKNIMRGYWNNPEKTAAVLRDGALWTGDLAKIDDEGYLYIVSRKSDMIKSGAHRISPKEIEEVIHELEGIHEVAVIGMPDDIMGESILACIVLTDDAACSDKDVKRYCREKLPMFKAPKEVIFIEQLPKTASGKIRKKVLKEQLQEGLPD